MRTLNKVTLAGLLAVMASAAGFGCSSSEVDRADVPAMPVAKSAPVEQLPEDQRPGEGSSAGMTMDPTRGLTGN